MKLSITLLFLSWSVAALAESGGKQLLLPDSVQSPTLYTYYSNLFRLYEQSAGQVLFHPSAKYGTSSASAILANCEWRTFQMPQKSEHYQISSRGATQLNSIKLMGEFQYQRSFEDSIGWILKTDLEDKSPYYLANQKPGNWDTHTYLLKGAGSFALAGPVHAILGAELNLGTYGRFTDPRPETNRYRLKLNGGIGYKTDNFGVSVTGIYGYGDENTVVTYANTMNNTPGRPAYVTHDIMGYGYSRTNGSDKPRLNEELTVTGIGVVLQARMLNIAYAYNQTDREYTKKLPSGTSAVGDVSEGQHTFVGSFTFATPAADHLASFALSYAKLKDFNRVIINGNNYLATVLELSPSYLLKKGSWEYFGSAHVYQENRKDGSAAVKYNIQTASLILGGSKLFDFAKRYLKVESQVSYRTNMGSSLSIGSQYNDFIRGVVLPDYTYYSTNQAGLIASVGYGFKLKEIILMPALRYQLQKPINPTHNLNAAFQPKHIRNCYSFGLNIHM